MRWLIVIMSLLLVVALVPTSVVANEGPQDPPPKGGGMKPPRHEGSTVHLQTNSFVVNVHVEKAEVVYGYPATHEPPYHLQFVNLVGYNDSGEAGYQRDETLYKAPLDGKWQLGQVIHAENDRLGLYSMFNMSKEVDFHAVGGSKEKILGAATLTLHFLLATNNFTETLDSGISYDVAGSSELKIDIEITFHKELPVSKLAVEQVLFNQPPPGEKDRFFQMEEDHRKQKLHPGFEDTYEHKFKDKQAGHQHIGLVNTEELEEGFYNWVSEAELSQNETTQLENVTTTYATDGSGLRIYLSYPMIDNLSSIYHDPSVGVVAANLPQFIEQAAKDFIELLLSFGLGGLLAVGAIGAVTLVAVKQKNGA